VDGNKPEYGDLVEVLRQRIEAQRASGDGVSLLAFTVMPGPQLAAAVPVTKRIKALFPEIPIVWGGYFASLYPQPTGNAPFIDFLVRGQGEKTFLELLDVLAGKRDPGPSPGWAGKDSVLVSTPAQTGDCRAFLPHPRARIPRRRTSARGASTGLDRQHVRAASAICGSAKIRARPHRAPPRVPRERAQHGLRALLRQRFRRGARP
jgi:hypothetical protein